jgi:hypothetical protein
MLGVDVQRDAFQVKRFGQAVQQALGDRGGVGWVGVGQQDRELVAAKAHQQVVGVEVVGQARADLAQELVAHVVAERVVDLLEAVQVHDQQGDRLPLGSLGQGGVQLAVQQAAVAQAGQVVGQCLTARLGQRAHLSEGDRGPDHHREQGPGGKQDGQGRYGLEVPQDGLEVPQDQHADRTERKQRRQGQHRPALQPRRPVMAEGLPGGQAHQHLRDHWQRIQRRPGLVGPGGHPEQEHRVGRCKHHHPEREQPQRPVRPATQQAEHTDHQHQ